MRKLRLAAALFGAGILLVCTFAYLNPDGLLALKPFIRSFNSSEMHVDTRSVRQIVTASVIGSFTTTFFDVKYFNPIKMGSTLKITANLSQFTTFLCTPDSDYSCFDPYEEDHLRWPIEISITAPAFEISEPGRVKQISSGARLPLEFSWAVFPKSAGDQSIILDVSKVHNPPSPQGAPGTFSSGTTYGHYAHLFDQEISINDSALDLTKANFTDVPIDVKVLTVWGIEERWYQWIIAISAVIGFCLTLPAGIEYIRKLLSPAKKRPNPPPITEPSRPRRARRKR